MVSIIGAKYFCFEQSIFALGIFVLGIFVLGIFSPYFACRLILVFQILKR